MSPGRKSVLFVKPGARIKNQQWAIHSFARICGKDDRYDAYLLTDNCDGESVYPARVFTGYGDSFRWEVGGWKELFRRWIVFYRVTRLLRPDIIHINNHMGIVSIFVIARLIAPGAIIVLDIRTLPDQRLKYWYYRVISPWFDWVFGCNSDVIKRLVLNERSSILPLGYDPVIFSVDDDSEELSPYVAGQKLKCLYYGSLDRKRKLINLCKAFEVCRNKGIDVCLNIVGAGNDRKRLIKFIFGRDLGGSIRVMEFLPQKELADLIKMHHIGISYVPNEGMYIPQVPLKTVEMLACGLPILATNTKGNVSIVKDGQNGFVAEDTPTSMANVLGRIYTDGFSSRMRISAVNTVKDMRWDELVRLHLLKVYDELIGNSGTLR